jgi:SOS response regulatory protein OraA/RecX
VGYVHDGRYAAARAEALAARGYGDEAIRHLLGTDGVGAQQVEAALAALAPEQERAARIVARRGASARTAAQLARKGFAPETIETVFDGAPAEFAEDGAGA